MYRFDHEPAPSTIGLGNGGVMGLLAQIPFKIRQMEATPWYFSGDSGGEFPGQEAHLSGQAQAPAITRVG
jgi:hypothetical protein